MTFEEKNKENINHYRKQVLWACDNENNVSINYSNFLTTLAGIFLTVSPLIISYGNTSNASAQNSPFLKLFFSISIVFIFLSLVFGGIYNFLKKKFFIKWTWLYSELFSQWNNIEKEEDKKLVKNFEETIFLQNKTQSSQWPIVVQSGLLLMGIFLMVMSFILKIL